MCDDRDPSDARKEQVEDQMVEDHEYREKHGVAGLVRLRYLLRDGGVAESNFWFPPSRLPPMTERVHLAKAKRILTGRQRERLEVLLVENPELHTVVVVSSMEDAQAAVASLGLEPGKGEGR